ncbi:uncharacterized protein LOC135959990 [Calliphora vicina]|uniref:uncharacterized protein LOC135959990 n=1 Tax=Calliphora vicina TaxID=7373 RepID=UPI00325A75A5
MSLSCIILHLLLASTVAASLNSSTTQPLPQMVNSSLVLDIVTGLHQRLEFHNFVFYISQRLLRDTETFSNFFQDFWQTLPFIPVTIIIDNPRSMVGMLSTPCLCFIMTTEWQDPIMELAALSLKSIRYYRTMFLLFPQQEYEDDDYDEFSLSLEENIRLLYDWVWKKQFLNTMLITINNNILLYDPYPTGIVVNKTSNWSLEDIFRMEKLNLKGFAIKTPIRYDLPRVFSLRRYPNKGRVSKLTGTSGKLFGAFIMSINGSFDDKLIHEHEFEPFDLIAFIKMVETKQVEISVHSYTSMINASVGTSYPIGINDWCLMVPYRNSSPEYMFLQKTFHLSSWLLLCFAVLYIMLGIWLCAPPQERDLSLSFLESISSIMQLAPLKLITLPFKRLRFLFVLLFVVGFCLSNIYLTKMASKLTASSEPRQIDSIQDIIDAKLNIMVLGLEYNALLRMNNSPEFLKFVMSVSKPVMDKHRDCLNTTYGYSVSTDRWRFINKQQDFLKKPRFRLTTICSGPFYHVFPLQKDSHLLQPLKDFILAVSQSGYIFFWDEEAFDDALFLGYVQMFKNDHGFTALSINFFLSIYVVWFFGLLLAAVIFLLEVKRVTIWKIHESMAKGVRCLKRKFNGM